MDVGEMRKRFDDNVASLLLTKREDNKAFLSRAEYFARICDVKKSKMTLRTPGAKKSMRDYKIVRKYDVASVGGQEKLVRPALGDSERLLHYATNEELFDILHSTHMAIGHGGRNRMVSETKSLYSNITAEAIMLYLRTCTDCQKKATKLKKGLVSKPTSRSALESQAQVDLIDKRSMTYNGFCYVLVYRDRPTNFTILRHLKSNRPKEIASRLLDIFTIFGFPVVLHSDDRNMVLKTVVSELHEMWPDLKIVIAKPSENDAKESENDAVNDLISNWMMENKSSNWPDGLKFVQFKNNCKLHPGAGSSSYEAMFGRPVRLGLLSLNIPQTEFDSINTEEDIEKLMEPLEEHYPLEIEYKEFPDDPNASGKSNPKKARLGEKQCTTGQPDPLEITISDVKIEPSEPVLTSGHKAEDERSVSDAAEDGRGEATAPIKEEHNEQLFENVLPNTATGSIASKGPVPAASAACAVGGFVTNYSNICASRASITSSADGHCQSTHAMINSDTEEIDVYCKSMAAKLKTLPREIVARLQHKFDCLISYEMEIIKL